MPENKAGVSVCGNELRVQGRLCRVARLDGDDFKFLDDPEAVLAEVRKTRLRIDLFTFLQGLPGTPTKYSYPMEFGTMLPSCLYPRSRTGGQSRSDSRRGIKPSKRRRKASQSARFLSTMS